MNNVINFANDLGNSTIKGIINNTSEKIPSVIAELRTQDAYAPKTFNDDSEQDEYFNNLLNHLDVSIASSAISHNNRMLVGQAALDSHLPITGFDVNDYSGKSETDRAIILTLSTIAANRVTSAYHNNENVLEPLKVDVNMTTALPISEGERKGVIEQYQQRYLSSDHVVTFHNFKNPITVQIHFNVVMTALEGQTAQYAIREAPSGLVQNIVSDFNTHYPNLVSQGMDPSNLHQFSNILGIDIGDGTTDLIVFQNGQTNYHASTSLDQGYGNALEEAIVELQNQRFNIENRAALQNLINKMPTNFIEKGKQKLAQNVVEEQLQNLTNAIVSATSKTLRKASANIDAIFVYGGGSIPMAYTDLRNELMTKIHNFSGFIDIPVIWINESYAQYLNVMGLKIILDRLLAQQQGTQY